LILCDQFVVSSSLFNLLLTGCLPLLDCLCASYLSLSFSFRLVLLGLVRCHKDFLLSLLSFLHHGELFGVVVIVASLSGHGGGSKGTEIGGHGLLICREISEILDSVILLWWLLEA